MDHLDQTETTLQQREETVGTGQPLRKLLCAAEGREASLLGQQAFKPLDLRTLPTHWGLPKGEGKAESLLNSVSPFPAGGEGRGFPSEFSLGSWKRSPLLLLSASTLIMFALCWVVSGNCP